MYLIDSPEYRISTHRHSSACSKTENFCAQKLKPLNERSDCLEASDICEPYNTTNKGQIDIPHSDRASMRRSATVPRYALDMRFVCALARSLIRVCRHVECLSSSTCVYPFWHPERVQPCYARYLRQCSVYGVRVLRFGLAKMPELPTDARERLEG